MSYDLRITIDGYVENCIVQKAQEKYLVKLNSILDELEADANELAVREKGVNVVIRKGVLVCGRCYSCAEGNIRYCDNCGIKLIRKDK